MVAQRYEGTLWQVRSHETVTKMASRQLPQERVLKHHLQEGLEYQSHPGAVGIEY